MEPETRSAVAKESISRLCTATNLRKYSTNPVSIKRNEEVGPMLADTPNLLHSGTKIQLCVTGSHLNIVSCATREVIITHEMPNVSFASSGDEDTVDFVAYVAKDPKFGRACFVLECGYEMAKNVLATIAKAFQKRAQQISSNSTTLRIDRRMIKTPSTSATHNTLDLDLMEPPKTPKLEITANQEDMRSVIRASLENEEWYHGPYLSREDSETRLKQDGDFLVRESFFNHGQFVLSAMHNNVKRHLLLVDAMGVVRTKEMTFNNISHLVVYHRDNGLPIVSAEGVLYLRNGIKPPKVQVEIAKNVNKDS